MSSTFRTKKSNTWLKRYVASLSVLYPCTTNIWYILSKVVFVQFVLAAQHICQKLRNAGCWADFVNPFSGVPAIGAYARKQSTLEANECVPPLDFSITERHHCRVIEDKKARSFIGKNSKFDSRRSPHLRNSHYNRCFWNSMLQCK